MLSLKKGTYNKGAMMGFGQGWTSKSTKKQKNAHELELVNTT